MTDNQLVHAPLSACDALPCTVVATAAQHVYMQGVAQASCRRSLLYCNDLHDLVNLLDVVKVPIDQFAEVDVLHTGACHRRYAASCLDEACGPHLAFCKYIRGMLRTPAVTLG